MLLRVEVFAHDEPLLEGDGATQDKSRVTYVCRAAAAAADEDASAGSVLTVGRKASDVILDTDKSVSRSHCVLEIDDSSSDGTTAVLHDFGSKFGTYVVVPKKTAPATRAADESDATGDDETDDEAPSQQAAAAGLIPLSPTTVLLLKKLHVSWNETTIRQAYELAKVEPKGKFTLNSLSSLSQHQHEPKGNMSKMAIFQVGQSGSTICLTNVSYEVSLSRIAAPQKKKLIAASKAMGAGVLTFHSDWIMTQNEKDPFLITHLCTPEKLCTAKCLTAWCSQTPWVTPEFFLDGLSSYLKLPSEVPQNKHNNIILTSLPNEKDYPPTGSIPMDQWSEHDLSKSNTLLQQYRFLCIFNDEMPPLVKAAGASIVPLYDLTDTEFSNALEDNDWTNPSTTQVTVWVGSQTKSKTLLKRKALFVKAFPDSIPCVTPREVASAITDMRSLTDTNAMELVPASTMHSTTDQATTENVPDVASPMEVEPIVANDDDEPSSPTKLTGSRVTRQSTPTRKEKGPISREKKGTKTVHAKASVIPEDDVILPSPTEDFPMEVENSDEAEDNNIIENGAKGNETDEVSPKRKRDTTAVDASSSRKKHQSIGSGVSLPKTDNGWLVAAPSGTKRRDYRVSDANLEEQEIMVCTPADSELCKGLIVRTVEAAKESMVAARNKSTTSSNKPNFKKFQKNSILAGNYRAVGSARIRLCSVLPKESERQRQLELSQREVEREEQIADALFTDVQKGPSRRRGGGSSGNSVRSFFNSNSAPTSRKRTAGGS